MRSTSSPIDRSASRAVLQAGFPDLLALVPIRHPPQAAINSRHLLEFGTLTARVPLPWWISSGSSTLSGSTMVRAPGQYSFASRTATPLSRTRREAVSKLSQRTGTGFPPLPFILKSLSAASSFIGSQPRPYTVSVGYTMTPPPSTSLAASRMLFAEIFVTPPPFFIFILEQCGQHLIGHRKRR